MSDSELSRNTFILSSYYSVTETHLPGRAVSRYFVWEISRRQSRGRDCTDILQAVSCLSRFRNRSVSSVLLWSQKRENFIFIWVLKVMSKIYFVTLKQCQCEIIMQRKELAVKQISSVTEDAALVPIKIVPTCW